VTGEMMSSNYPNFMSALLSTIYSFLNFEPISMIYRVKDKRKVPSKRTALFSPRFVALCKEEVRPLSGK
jgi:hypothetical protein